MNNTKLLAAGLLCIVAVAALLYSVKGCSRSTADQMNENARRRICYGCAHRWSMDNDEIVKQKKLDPTHQGWVQCPKCKEWKGVQERKCNKCGAPIPQVMPIDASEGTFRGPPPKRHYCDECAGELGISPSDALQPGTEPAD